MALRRNSGIDQIGAGCGIVERITIITGIRTAQNGMQAGRIDPAGNFKAALYAHAKLQGTILAGNDLALHIIHIIGDVGGNSLGRAFLSLGIILDISGKQHCTVKRAAFGKQIQHYAVADIFFSNGRSSHAQLAEAVVNHLPELFRYLLNSGSRKNF